MTDAATIEPRVSGAAALYLALLQFLFNLCWVVYAIYLRSLAMSVSQPAR
jgi:hypothetical protein